MNRSYIHAISWRLIALISSVLSGLVVAALYTRHFSKEMATVLLAALNVIGYLPLFDGGFRTVANRRLLISTSEVEKSRIIEVCQSLYSALAIVFFVAAEVLVSVYATTPNPREAGVPYVFFVVMGLVAALNIICGSQMGLLLGLGAQKQMFILQTLIAWVTLGALQFWLHAGYGYWSLPIAYLSQLVVIWPVTVIMIKRIRPGIKLFGWNFGHDFRAIIGDMWTEAWACFRSQTSILLLFSLDQFFIGAYCKSSAAYLVLARFFAYVRSMLQSIGEVSWPLIAQKEEMGHKWGMPLLRLNGWIYGAVLGSMVLTLPGFVLRFATNEYEVSPTILLLLVGRFLITGLSSPVSYFLFGMGDFVQVARRIERELVLAVVIAIPFVYHRSAEGVAAAFLVATFVGTLFPLMSDYARRIGHSAWSIFGQVWWRGLLSFGLSVSLSFLILQFEIRGYALVMVGAVAALGTLLLPVVWAYTRAPRMNGLQWLQRARLIVEHL